MADSLNQIAERFGACYELLCGALFGRRTVLDRAGAFLLTGAGRSVGREEAERAIVQSRNMLEREKIPSTEMIPLLAVLLLVDGGGAHFAIRLHQGMRALKRKFYPSAQLIWSAALMALLEHDAAAYDGLARRIRVMQKEMDTLYGLCGSYRDIPLCTLYALRGEKELQIRLRSCAEQLKMLCSSNRSIYAAAQVLAIYPDGADRCLCVARLQKKFSEQSVFWGQSTDAAALAVLAGLNEDDGLLIRQTGQMVKMLDHIPGLNLWSVSRKERLFWACLLAALNQRNGLAGRDALLTAALITASRHTPECLPWGETLGEISL